MNLSQLQSQLTALANRRDFTANTSLQQTFISQGVMRIQRELRCPAMEKSVQTTIPAAPTWSSGTTYGLGAVVQYNNQTYTSLQASNTGNEPDTQPTWWVLGGSYFQGLVIPSDFLELVDMYDTALGTKMTKVDLSKAIRGSTVPSASLPVVPIYGNPVEYARQGGLWLLAPMPPAGHVIQIDYWAELTPMVNPTDTNVISIIAWDLIVYAALCEFGVYYKDVRLGALQPDGSYDGWEGKYRSVLGALQEQSDEDDENGAAVVEPTYIYPLDWQFMDY